MWCVFIELHSLYVLEIRGYFIVYFPRFPLIFSTAIRGNFKNVVNNCCSQNFMLSYIKNTGWLWFQTNHWHARDLSTDDHIPCTVVITLNYCYDHVPFRNIQVFDTVLKDNADGTVIRIGLNTRRIMGNSLTLWPWKWTFKS